jgi:hypothetical protein
VWSNGVQPSGLATVPASIHGDTSTVGTRTPKRLKRKPNWPGAPGTLPSALTVASGATAPPGGGTWSKQPPCSSYVITSSVLSHAGEDETASYTSAISLSPGRTSAFGCWSFWPGPDSCGSRNV